MCSYVHAYRLFMCQVTPYFIIDMHGHNHYAADDDAAHMHVFDIYKLSQAWKLVVTLV